MRIYDPYSGRYRLFDACEVGSGRFGYVPVRSEQGGWFAVYMPTASSMVMEAVEDTDARRFLFSSVIAKDLIDRIVEASRDGIPDTATIDEATDGLTPLVREIALGYADERGLSPSDFQRLLSVHAPAQVVEASQTFSISALAAGG